MLQKEGGSACDRTTTAAELQVRHVGLRSKPTARLKWEKADCATPSLLVAIVEFDASRLARPQPVGDHARPLLGARLPAEEVGKRNPKCLGPCKD